VKRKAMSVKLVRQRGEILCVDTNCVHRPTVPTTPPALPPPFSPSFAIFPAPSLLFFAARGALHLAYLRFVRAAAASTARNFAARPREKRAARTSASLRRKLARAETERDVRHAGAFQLLYLSPSLAGGCSR
jgi:hypothetical protein